MNVFFNIVASLLLLVGISAAFGISSTRLVDDILSAFQPKDKLKSKVDDIQENKRRTGLYATLTNLRNALEATGKGKWFPLSILLSIIMGICGVVLAVMIGNVYLAPTFAIGCALIPFAYIARAINFYKRSTKEELETALSVITNGYLRSDNIINAVQESIPYIKPPLQHVFKAFVGDATFISSNTKQALYNMRTKVDDQVYFEWCTTLIQCQEDRSQKDNLLPIVSKLTDIRIVNNQLHNMLMSARMEYFTMAGMVVCNVPLLYFLNKDWFYNLIYTEIGKITLGVCGIAIIITMLLMFRMTQPIEYKG